MHSSLTVALAGGIGVLAGALITAGITLLSGWLSRRHDNRRWLLDRRLEVYASFNTAVNTVRAGQALVRAGQAEPKTLPELLPPLHNWQAQVALLAPEDVAETALNLTATAANALGLLVREITHEQLGQHGAGQGMNDLGDQYDELVKLQRRDIQGRPLSTRKGSKRRGRQ